MGIIIGTASSFNKKNMSEVQQIKKKPFKKQIYRGHELDKLLEMSPEAIVNLMKSRQQRRFRHGIHGKYERLIKKLREAKKTLNQEKNQRVSKLILEIASSSQRCATPSLTSTVESTGTQSKSRLI